MIAHESDTRSIGLPGGRRLVPFAFGQTIQFFSSDVVKVDVAVPARQQISLPILLVTITIDHDRLGRFRRRARRGTRGGFGFPIRITNPQTQALWIPPPPLTPQTSFPFS